MVYHTEYRLGERTQIDTLHYHGRDDCVRGKQKISTALSSYDTKYLQLDWLILLIELQSNEERRMGV